MTLLDGFEYAYHNGIKRGERIRHEELRDSYDRGYENGKKMQAAQIEGHISGLFGSFLFLFCFLSLL
jgi:hypothetical protein